MNRESHSAEKPPAGPGRIVVGLSGGVDSAVAAALLQEQGWEVIGATLRLQSCGGTAERRSCCGLDGVAQARAVAGQLGIPHYVVDAYESFTDEVLAPCWKAYAEGRTPNPCVLCNRHIKFGFLLDFARTLGARHVATGHYARVLPDSDGKLRLHRGVDRSKDQSYFLAGMTPEQLASAVMPLGAFTKAEVRRLAAARGFVNAERQESQDVCFALPDGGFPEYLRQKFAGETRPGEIRDRAGKILGRHAGIHRFTIGQRQGLGVALGQPAWVQEIDAAAGRVVVTTEGHDLETSVFSATGILWHGQPPGLGETLSCQLQTRYRQPPVPAFVRAKAGDAASVHLERPLRAVTPGQAVVFYQDDRVIGLGWIVDKNGHFGNPDDGKRP